MTKPPTLYRLTSERESENGFVFRRIGPGPWECEDGFVFRRIRPGALRTASELRTAVAATSATNGEAARNSAKYSESAIGCNKETVRSANAANENRLEAMETAASEKIRAPQKRRGRGTKNNVAAKKQRKCERRQKLLQDRKLYEEIDENLPNAERLVALVQLGLACDGNDDLANDAGYKRAVEEVVCAAKGLPAVRYRENKENTSLRARLRSLRLSIKVAQRECDDWENVRREKESMRPAIDGNAIDTIDISVPETEQVAQFAKDAKKVVEDLVLQKIHAQSVIKRIECKQNELDSRAQYYANRANKLAFVGAQVGPNAQRPPRDVGLARVFETPQKD